MAGHPADILATIMNDANRKPLLDTPADATWDLLVPTSMGTRLSPVDGRAVHHAHHFALTATSAETNVASVSSYLGRSVKVLTKFVRANPIARFIRDDLASRHLHVEGPEVDPGGPWGFRHQINIVDTGCGVRAPRVCNDRAGEVGRTLGAGDFDLDRIFGDEGVRMIHMTGLVAALSADTAKFCVALADAARRHGAKVSFDLNYRASFWEGREEALREAFGKIAEQADVLIGHPEQYRRCLGLDVATGAGPDLPAQLDLFKATIEQARHIAPRATIFAVPLREAIRANAHRWGAIMAAGEAYHTAAMREIPVIDRIGGGDGFVGGMLYGLLRGWDGDRCVQFGWAAGALAVSTTADYIQPADEDELWRIASGDFQVRR